MIELIEEMAGDYDGINYTPVYFFVSRIKKGPGKGKQRILVRSMFEFIHKD